MRGPVLTAKLRRSSFAVLSATGGFFIFLVSGCTPRSSIIDHPKPYANVKLTVACPSAAAEGVVSRYGAAWAADSGAQIEVVRYDAEAPSPPRLPGNVWIVPPARMPRFAAAGELLEVPGSYTSPGSPYVWDGILRDYQNKLLVWERKGYGLPLLGDTCLCFYRKDFL